MSNEKSPQDGVRTFPPYDHPQHPSHQNRENTRSFLDQTLSSRSKSEQIPTYQHPTYQREVL
jgi:hypothetical protein